VQLSGRANLTWPNNSQYFRSSRRHNWTSEHWYYGKIYGTPGKVITHAIKQLIAEGKIKRRWVEQDGEDLPTEVSGKVNADSKEKQTMKPTIRRCLALAIAFLGLYLALPDCGLAQNNQDQNDQGTSINLRGPNGTYPFQHSGYAPAIPPATGLVPLQATGQETFFANGTLTGLESFSYGGTIFRWVQAQRHLHGQYRW
jgi:hypothetical protein